MGVGLFLKHSDNQAVTAVIQSSSERVFAEANRVVTPASHLPWMSAQGGFVEEWLSFDFPDPRLVDQIAVIGHNFTSNASVSMVWSDSPGESAGSLTLPVEPEDLWSDLLPAVSARHWRLEIFDPTNQDGFIRIGYLAMGMSRRLPRGFELGWELSRDNRAQVFESESGATFPGDKLAHRRVYSISYNSLRESDRNEIEAVISMASGSVEPVVFIPNSDLPDVIMGKITNQPARTEAFVNSWEINRIIITEDSKPLITLRSALEYSPGDPFESFLRDSPAMMTTREGLLVEVQADIIRDDNWAFGRRTTLLEKASSNLILNSATGAGDNTGSTNMTVVTNAAEAPDGSATATRLTPTSASDQHFWSVSPINQPPSGTFAAVSVYLKADGHNFARLLFRRKDNTSLGSVIFNLTTAEAVVGGLSMPSQITDGTVAIDKLPSGWVRIMVRGDTLSGAVATAVTVSLTDSTGNPVFIGNGVDSVLAWGLQMEPSTDIPSSLIRTFGAVGQRSTDELTLRFDEPIMPIACYALFDVAWNISGGDAGEHDAVEFVDGSSPSRIKLKFQELVFRAELTTDLGGMVTVTTPNSTTRGQQVEMAATITPDSATRLITAVNGVSEATAVSPTTIPMTTRPNLIRVGQWKGANAHPLILRKVRVVRGDHAEMKDIR